MTVILRTEDLLTLVGCSADATALSLRANGEKARKISQFKLPQHTSQVAAKGTSTESATT